MLVRCWGSRGSIPVSGKEYLKYGGDTTCIEIRTKNNEIIIVDAGSGIRKLGNYLISENRFRYNMIFTHAHWDHLMGFPFFKPLYMGKAEIAMFGCPFAQASIKEMLSRVMTPPNFPVDYESIHADITYKENCSDCFMIDSVAVASIPLSHPNQGKGYKFTEDGKSFVFLTDNELTFRHPGGLDYQHYVEFASQADLLVHDAEFTKDEYVRTRKWGHSVYSDALDLALDAGVKRFGLFHHNQDRNDGSIDMIVAECRKIVESQKASLECFALYQGMEIHV